MIALTRLRTRAGSGGERREAPLMRITFNNLQNPSHKKVQEIIEDVCLKKSAKCTQLHSSERVNKSQIQQPTVAIPVAIMYGD